MTNPEKIHRFLKNNLRRGFCDDCLGKNTGVNRHEVNTITSTSALFPKEFKRTSSVCPQECNTRDKLATEAL